MNDAVDEIPWGELGEAWWLEAADAGRWSRQQAKFAACQEAGMTQHAAAKLAGYSGEGDQLRKIGSATANTVGVKQLRKQAVIALELLGKPQSVQPLLTKSERMEKLSEIARGADRSLAIRAIEALEKNEQRQEEIATFPLDYEDGLFDWRLVRDNLRIPGGAVAILSIYDGLGRAIEDMPLLIDVFAMVERDSPAFLDHIRRKQSRASLREINERLANPRWQYENRVQVWREAGKSIGDVEALAKPGAETNQHVAVASLNGRSMIGAESGADAPG